MDNITKVGVYGTLKQGRGNHYLLEHVEKRTDALVRGHRLYQSGIPFLVEDESSGYAVQIEVYDVDDPTLRNLDSLEGHPDCYCRKELQVELANGETDVVWIYQYPHPVGEENVSGVF